MIKALTIICLFISYAFAADYIGLDVRTAGELVSNPAPGAIHISISDLTRESIKRLPKDKTIKIFCESGGRAGKAKHLLEANGLSKVENIGSWREWNKLNNSNNK